MGTNIRPSTEKDAKTCGNCKHSKWERTPTGRIKKKLAGECKAVVPQIMVPMCYRVNLQQSYVWFDYAAERCPTYERS